MLVLATIRYVISDYSFCSLVSNIGLGSNLGSIVLVLNEGIYIVYLDVQIIW